MGAASSYATSALLQELNITLTRNETKRVEMMLHTATKKVEIFEIQIQDVTSNFNFAMKVRKGRKVHFNQPCKPLISSDDKSVSAS